jgi:hypothetical protein
LFDVAEEVFDEMAPTVHGEVAGNGCLAIGLGRDHGECPALVEFVAKPVVVESLVADQRADHDTVEQRRDADAVMALPRQEDEARKVAQCIDQGDDLGRQATA